MSNTGDVSLVLGTLGPCNIIYKEGSHFSVLNNRETKINLVSIEGELLDEKHRVHSCIQCLGIQESGYFF